MNRKKMENNKSGYVGVYFNKARNKFKASIYNNNKRIHLGYFDTALEASEAYETKAKELFGEYKREIN
jgi:hypothetical protein